MNLIADRIDEARLVDDYVLACAEASAAEERKALAKAALLACGLRSLRGTLNKVSVSEIAGRQSVNTKQMVIDGLITKAQLEEYTTTGAPSTRVSVSALS